MEALQEAFPLGILILFCVALVLCSIGFYKFVYFLSVGYGFAISGIGITILIFGLTHFENYEVSSWLAYLLIIMLILYGVRLSGFLLFREAKSASYRKAAGSTLKKDGSDKKMPIFVKIVIWLMVGVLYVMETSPIFYRVVKGAATSSFLNGTNLIAPLIGFIVMVIGLSLETIADLQKSYYKKKLGNRFIDKGLYIYCRCPNYLGEILFWTGCLISSVDVLGSNWAMWIMVILGYILIVYVMVSGAKRLEKRHLTNYGNDEEFQKYVKKTPILSRLIPIKSLQNRRFIK